MFDRCTITEPGKVSNIEDIIFNLGKLRHTGCFSNLKNDDLIWNSFDVYMIRVRNKFRVLYN